MSRSHQWMDIVEYWWCNSDFLCSRDMTLNISKYFQKAGSYFDIAQFLHASMGCYRYSSMLRVCAICISLYLTQMSECLQHQACTQNLLLVRGLTLRLYRVSQEECARLREDVPYVKVYQYNPKHLCPKLNGYGYNGQRSLKLWQLLHTYWLPNTY